MCNSCSSKSSFLDGLDHYSLDDAVISSSSSNNKNVDNRPKHPCHECNGTGIYKGFRVHQTKTQCFACKGKGYFLMSYADRMKLRQKTKERKQNVIKSVQDTFNEQNPELIDRLRGISSWHSFAKAMIEAYEKYGSLTDNQTAAAKNSLIKIELKRSEQQAKKEAKSGEVSVEAIAMMFNRAKSRGGKKPKFMFKQLMLSAAPDHGRNPGAIYVNFDGIYSGKIVNGKLFASKDAPDNIIELLNQIPDNIEDAIKFGKQTGTCACCGKTLTDPKSVEAGIGPICASRWF